MDNYLLNEVAREKILAGANKVADAVALTLGAAGASAIIQTENFPGHKVVDDGVSVAQSIQLSDPYENLGANMMKEIAQKADKDSGDGTSTATVIARAILNEWTPEVSPQELKKSLDECLPLIHKTIDDQKKPITPSEVGAVATTSSNDPELGKLLQEVYETVGASGIVELDNSNLPDTFFEIVDGIRFRNAGFLGAYSTTEPGRAVYTDPKILVSKEKITSVNQIQPICEFLSNRGINELVILCNEIDPAVASRMALTHLQGQFKSLIIQAPTLFKDWVFEDFAYATGATPVSTAEGKTFKTLKYEDLGTCEKIITTRDETRILGGRDLTPHIAAIKERLKDDDNLQMRLSWLQTKVAILKMGANSESELSGKRAKAIDAISACHHALDDGVVVGGGRALYDIKLPDTIGGDILTEALRAPLAQLELNMGYSMPSEDVLMSEGILDPAKVVKNSVSAAISVAGTLLSTKVAIINHAILG